MVGTAAAHASLSPLALETVVAVALVALLVTIVLVLVYAFVAGSAACALVLVLGVLRLVWTTVHRGGRGLRRRLHRAHGRVRQIAPETVPDLRARPLG